MTRKHLLPLAVALTVVALLVCAGPQAQAAEPHHHYQIKVMPRAARPDGKVIHSNLANGLYSAGAAFVGTPYSDSAIAGNSAGVFNADGTEVWPCFGGYDGSTESTENADCEYFEDTGYTPKSVPLPAGAAILGTPSYTWSLADCDASASTVNPCGQTNTWYEDDSNDSTDELLYIIEVTQGTAVIADSGTVDFGPNVYGGLSPAADVVIYGDQNFGTMGETGENNGNCEASFGYPLATNANPGSVYTVQANKTCVAPVAGLAKLTATTEIASPAYTALTRGTGGNGQTCTKTAPCYDVKYTVKYKLAQSWDINLE
jgi:hypothetical protein